MSIGTTRNPWDWYVSWWRHIMSLGPAYQRQLAIVGGGSLAFEDVVYGATHGRAPHPRPGIFVDGDGLDFAASGVGLFSWLHREIYAHDGRWLVDFLVDMHGLPAGLSEVTGYDLTTVAPRNVGDARADTPPRPEVTETIAGWIADADAALISLLGWPGPGMPAARTVTAMTAGDL